MKSQPFLLFAALGLSAATLRADDPLPAHVLTLDSGGHPRTDLNLGSAHVTGTLDAARLPAGVGSAFLAAVNRPTGTDATALDHVPVTGLAPGEVRQMVFTSGLDAFEGGTDTMTGYPFTYAAATYRLVTTPGDAGGPKTTSAPDTIPTPTAGRVWRLVSAALSNGDVVLPNGTVLGLAAPVNTGQAGGYIRTSGNGGFIDTTGGGYIRTSSGGGFIDTSGGGHIDTSGGGSISTSGGGSIDTSNGGYIDLTAGGGYLSTSGGGYLDLSFGGGHIDTSAYGGSIDTSAHGGAINTSSGGAINTSNGGGGIDTSNGGGPITTVGGAALFLGGSGSPEGVVYASIGSLYTDHAGGAGRVLYVKESDDGGPTGWAAK